VPRHRVLWLTGEMNPLLAEPTTAQTSLLTATWTCYAQTGTWPIYQYVDHDDHDGQDAETVLRSAPRMVFRTPTGHYGWLWAHGSSALSPQPSDTIGLTVVGMSRLLGASQEVALFLQGLNVLVGLERSFTPNPSTVQAADVTSQEMRRLIPRRLGFQPARDEIARLGDLFRHEPSTWRCVSPGRGDEPWTATLNSSLRTFAGVQDAADYAERLWATFSPPAPAPLAATLSALALPEAIDYLNAVWRVRSGKPLLTIQRAEAAAKLAFDCSTADEFDSRLSALCSILGHVAIPGVRETALVDLDGYLSKQLDDDAAVLASEALADLRGLFNLRAWRQHPGTEGRGLDAMRRLGVRLPTDDWGTAWRTLQIRTVAALNALRDQIELIDRFE